MKNKVKNNHFTQEYLKEVYDYDPNTGHLLYKIKTSNSIKIGDIPGYFDKEGYRIMSVKSSPYFAHRIIWFWHFGKWPEYEIDHINLNKNDNRINNLRDVTRSVNSFNKYLHVNNKSGYRGVIFIERIGKYRSNIKINKKNKYLGYFKYIQDAIAARKKAEKDLGVICP